VAAVDGRTAAATRTRATSGPDVLQCGCRAVDAWSYALGLTAFGRHLDRYMLIVEPQPVPLTTTTDGRIRVTGTRVPLETIVRAFHQGATAEEIVQDFSTLTLAQVYTVLAYYLWHRDAVDAYVAERAALSDSMRTAHESRFDQTGLRARLLARQSGHNSAA
jgi:uncharacterized protein (DUF433 family)